MKKMTMAMLIVGLFCSSVFSFKLGLEFQAGSQMMVGANMRLSDQFELKPYLGFSITDQVSFFELGVDGNYYLRDLGQVNQYVGGGLNLGFASEQDASFGLNNHYGLRYSFNDVLSMFGQVGLNFNFTPEFYLSTFTSGAGLTIYILNR